LSAGFGTALKNLGNATDFVIERSGEMRDRFTNIDRDVADGMRRLSGKSSVRANVMRFAFSSIGYVDRIVAVPTWLGAYNKALSQGMDEAEAIYAADKAVRLSQGAGSAKDLAAVARGKGRWGEALKMFTMFYTYLSAYYNRSRTLGRDAPKNFPKALARLAVIGILGPLIAEILAGRGPDEENEESVEGWILKTALFNGLGPLPFVRDLAKPAVAKLTDMPSYGYSLSPLQSAGDAIVRSFGDLGNLFDPDEESSRATRNTMETIGYATGMVPGQVAVATQFLVDVFYGEQDPETVGEWLEGLRSGKFD
jgi:hypothetical protein